jgi:hypothetical protein
MQISMTTFTAAATMHRYPLWLKNAATMTFLLLFIKGAIWLGATWLAFRGVNGM